MSKLKSYSLFHKEVRSNLGLTQESYWGALGVTQSAGSRYESDERKIPDQINALAYLKYKLGLDLNKFNQEFANDLKVVAKLKSTDKAKYDELLRSKPKDTSTTKTRVPTKLKRK